MSDNDYDEDVSIGDDKGRNKSRRELPAGAVSALKNWLLSPEHFSHPYPTPQDQTMLMQKTGIDKKQLKNWFTNARRRIWKPMLKKQIESGQLTATPSGIPGVIPGLMLSTIPGASASLNTSMENPHSVQAIRAHYQQASKHQESGQEQQQAVPLDPYGNPLFSSSEQTPQYYSSHQMPSDGLGLSTLSSVSSLGNLRRQSSNVQLSKTDSHAVLMELFARDQDLVRQATESARLKAEAKQQMMSGGQQASQGASQSQVSSQHPMKAPTAQGSSSGQHGGALQGVPSMNSWPHFSSITSLNNLGTLPGVKSITSLSGTDLASKGEINKNGNLAQVKSMESFGKNDSYAFLEVFFGDRSTNSSANLNSFGSLSNLAKFRQLGDEDNEIGLSLEDESPSQPMRKELYAAAQPAPLTAASENALSSMMESETLKRAYDDALAARGLMSVSRSSENLTDLVLPEKIQRTLSQEFINKELMHQQIYSRPVQTSAPMKSNPAYQQYPGQQPVEPDGSSKKCSSSSCDPSENGGHVQVPIATKCALCSQTNVDTQLRPCGHMFHERCLKPSLQSPRGPPKCPIDDIPMHSAVLAVPTDDYPPQQTQSSWNYGHMQAVPSATDNSRL